MCVWGEDVFFTTMFDNGALIFSKFESSGAFVILAFIFVNHFKVDITFYLAKSVFDCL